MANTILGRDMAVDLGTSTTQIYARGKGVVLTMPTSRLGEMPIRDGVIADFDLCVGLLRSAIARVHTRRYLARPRLVVAIPALTTAVERRALTEAGYEAGARQVVLVDAPLMAAIGAGLPVHRPEGTMVVTMGSGLTEIAVLSLGAVVSSTSARVNGTDLDRAISAWMRAEHGLQISDLTAEDLKLELGSAWPIAEHDALDLAAPDLHGQTRTVSVRGADLRHALSAPLRDIIEAIGFTLDSTPGLADNIRDQGLVLAGGASQLPGLDILLSHELDLPVLVAPQPVSAVAAGAGRCVEDADLLRSVMDAHRKAA